MVGARFNNLPIHNVVTVVDDVGLAETIRSELVGQGVDAAAVSVLSGERGLRLLDPDGNRHGWRSRFLRKLERASAAEEERYFEQIQSALERGRCVLSVAVEQERQRHRVGRTIRRHTPGTIFHFGRWATEELEPRHNPFEAASRRSVSRTRSLLFLSHEADRMRECVQRFADAKESTNDSRDAWAALAETLEHISDLREGTEAPDNRWLIENTTTPDIDRHAILEEFERGLGEARDFARMFLDRLVQVLQSLDQEDRERFLHELWDVAATPTER